MRHEQHTIVIIGDDKADAGKEQTEPVECLASNPSYVEAFGMHFLVEYGTMWTYLAPAQKKETPTFSLMKHLTLLLSRILHEK